MWHLKTKLGTFWVLPLAEKKGRFVLGLNDEELSFYTDTEQAARAVHDQSTGCLKWDIASRPTAPEHITEWVEGEPKEWSRCNQDPT